MTDVKSFGVGHGIVRAIVKFNLYEDILCIGMKVLIMGSIVLALWVYTWHQVQHVQSGCWKPPRLCFVSITDYNILGHKINRKPIPNPKEKIWMPTK